MSVRTFCAKCNKELIHIYRCKTAITMIDKWIQRINRINITCESATHKKRALPRFSSQCLVRFCFSRNFIFWLRLVLQSSTSICVEFSVLFARLDFVYSISIIRSLIPFKFVHFVEVEANLKRQQNFETKKKKTTKKRMNWAELAS